MSNKVIITAEDLNRILDMATLHRERLVEEVAKAFPGREAYAVAVALAGLFATSMTSDPDQQSSQAQVLNEILGRWAGHRLPWRLVPEQ